MILGGTRVNMSIINNAPRIYNNSYLDLTLPTRKRANTNWIEILESKAIYRSTHNQNSLRNATNIAQVKDGGGLKQI